MTQAVNTRGGASIRSRLSARTVLDNQRRQMLRLWARLQATDSTYFAGRREKIRPFYAGTFLFLVVTSTCRRRLTGTNRVPRQGKLAAPRPPDATRCDASSPPVRRDRIYRAGRHRAAREKNHEGWRMRAEARQRDFRRISGTTENASAISPRTSSRCFAAWWWFTAQHRKGWLPILLGVERGTCCALQKTKPLFTFRSRE